MLKSFILFSRSGGHINPPLFFQIVRGSLFRKLQKQKKGPWSLGEKVKAMLWGGGVGYRRRRKTYMHLGGRVHLQSTFSFFCIFNIVFSALCGGCINIFMPKGALNATLLHTTNEYSSLIYTFFSLKDFPTFTFHILALINFKSNLIRINKYQW